MQEWLINPVVQGAVLPLVVGLAVAFILAPLRLAGLAVCAGFASAVYLVAGFDFVPLTTVRKVILVGFLAAAIGIVADLAFKPTRLTVPILATALAAASVWIFLALLKQKELDQALLLGSGTAAYVAWQAGASMTLRDDPLRAGASSLALGLGTGVAAVLAASATLGLYAMAFGSASGAFLLVQMVTRRRVAAGMSLTLTAGALGGLLGMATLHLAQMPWPALVVLAFVPLAARVPVPQKWPVWGQVIAISSVVLGVAGVACYLVWESSRGAPV